MKNSLIFMFTITFTTTILSKEVHEYTGTISIKETNLLDVGCAQLYKISSISRRSMEQPHWPLWSLDNYPRYYTSWGYDEGHPIDQPKIPSDITEYNNKKHKKLVSPYYVMPQYIPNMHWDKQSNIFLFVEINLTNGEPLFNNRTLCYLPLPVFLAPDFTFKNAKDEIELLMRFTDYNDEIIHCNFTLELDETFNTLHEHWDEFFEDDKKPCHEQAINCFTRLSKKIKNSWNSFRNPNS